MGCEFYFLCALLLVCSVSLLDFVSLFFNDTAPTEIYTLSLHDALPISCSSTRWTRCSAPGARACPRTWRTRDRKSTRLNSSHVKISYAVFCLKKKKKKENNQCILHKKNKNQ